MEPREHMGQGSFRTCLYLEGTLSCAFVETTRAYICTDLENNQRLLNALKDEARETVKALLIHPGNVSAVME